MYIVLFKLTCNLDLFLLLYRQCIFECYEIQSRCASCPETDYTVSSSRTSYSKSNLKIHVYHNLILYFSLQLLPMFTIRHILFDIVHVFERLKNLCIVYCSTGHTAKEMATSQYSPSGLAIDRCSPIRWLPTNPSRLLLSLLYQDSSINSI